ncbi:MAG TPA: Gmad2 immunoglobulin-like domain-containing protein [Anaerolineales bacterium]|nr:Gmad2 immunoglobulin-like domain-containing protein [Anaerolineales bacterium]
MVSRQPLILLLAVLLIGCRPASATPTAPAVVTETPSPESSFITPGISTPIPPEEGISAEQVKNAPYELGASDVPRLVPLEDGAYQEGQPGDAEYLQVLVSEFIALGDLTGDGVNEAAAIISEYHGGTGVFVFLAVYSEQGGEAVFQTSAFVDDRPKVGGMAIEDNEVRLVATVHRLDEPMCCPTLETLRHYRLVNSVLDMTDYATLTPQGQPRTIKIESPAYGLEVSGSVQVKGSVAVAPFENNLSYVIKDAGDVILSQGAVSVTAADLGGPGTFEVTIPLSDILSGAVIVVEIQDVSAADGQLLGMDSVRLVVK